VRQRKIVLGIQTAITTTATTKAAKQLPATIMVPVTAVNPRVPARQTAAEAVQVEAVTVSPISLHAKVLLQNAYGTKTITMERTATTQRMAPQHRPRLQAPVETMSARPTKQKLLVRPIVLR
jgi:hypothetical protein